ncbi:hypothetical protein [Longispora albida]|uniref:hypothetical protein n=1 Tax=Longispora albida TaxID=203523 RepID=UPI00037C938C|nr:hypothetical protein [Longispora albida]
MTIWGCCEAEAAGYDLGMQLVPFLLLLLPAVLCVVAVRGITAHQMSHRQRAWLRTPGRKGPGPARRVPPRPPAARVRR